MGRLVHACRVMAALGCLALLGTAGSGQAQVLGLSGYAEAAYSSTEISTIDALGRSSHIVSSSIPQRYRLALDRQLFPLLQLSAVGSYDWAPGWSEIDGVWSRVSATRGSVDLRLILGGPVLNLTPFYWWREQAYSSQGADGAESSFGQIGQSFGVNGNWSPDGLPVLSFTWSRTDLYDKARISFDRTEDIAYLSANYLDLATWAFRYQIRYATTNDHLNDLKTWEVNQSLQVTWNDAFLDRRITTYANYQIGFLNGGITAAGGGVVLTQLFPVAGLSLVEQFPSVPTLNTLNPNPALIDGDLVASAGIDIGYQPTANGDDHYRDVGAQLADGLTPLNTVYVWTDRSLPPSVWGAYAWQAFRSEDNLNWFPVPLAGPVVFNAILNRFEIPTERFQGRFVKVVTRPLPLGVTSAPQYANVFVTEIQLFNAIPASEAPRSFGSMAGNFSGSLRWVFLDTPSLSYDFSAFGSHGDAFAIRTWTIANGLSYAQQLSSVFALNARLQHTDADQGFGWLSTNQWSAQLAASPLRTFGATFTLSGLHQMLPAGTYLTNSAILFCRADVYEGVSLTASGGYMLVNGPATEFSGPTASANVTITPMRALSLSGSYSLQSVGQSSATLGPVPQSTQSIQGQVTFTPINAVFLSAGAQRFVGYGARPEVLSNLSVGISPFPEGQLLLRFNYNENAISASQNVSRVYGPSLRWNIRPGAFLDVAYTWNDNFQPAQTTRNNNFFAQLSIVLR